MVPLFTAAATSTAFADGGHGLTTGDGTWTINTVA
jgi:hypothetical protein